MFAGKMDRQITIQSRSEAGNTFGGGGVITYTDVATVWAQMIPIRSTEIYQANQYDAAAIVKWRIRWRNDVSITEKGRVVYDGTNYDIQAVTELGRRDGLELLTIAKVPV